MCIGKFLLTGTVWYEVGPNYYECELYTTYRIRIFCDFVSVAKYSRVQPSCSLLTFSPFLHACLDTASILVMDLFLGDSSPQVVVIRIRSQYICAGLMTNFTLPLARSS